MQSALPFWGRTFFSKETNVVTVHFAGCSWAVFSHQVKPSFRVFCCLFQKCPYLFHDTYTDTRTLCQKFVMRTVCCGFFVLHSHMQRVNALANTPGWWTRQEQVPESERGRPRGKALQSQRNLLLGNLLYHQLCLGKRVGCSSWHSYLLFLGLYVFFAFWYQNLSFELYDAIAICNEPWRVFRKINTSNMNC